LPAVSAHPLAWARDDVRQPLHIQRGSSRVQIPDHGVECALELGIRSARMPALWVTRLTPGLPAVTEWMRALSSKRRSRAASAEPFSRAASALGVPGPEAVGAALFDFATAAQGADSLADLGLEAGAIEAVNETLRSRNLQSAPLPSKNVDY
jgi:hypothetical protein